jgi:hypothetical protein
MDLPTDGTTAGNYSSISKVENSRGYSAMNYAIDFIQISPVLCMYSFVSVCFCAILLHVGSPDPGPCWVTDMSLYTKMLPWATSRSYSSPLPNSATMNCFFRSTILSIWECHMRWILQYVGCFSPTSPLRSMQVVRCVSADFALLGDSLFRSGCPLVHLTTYLLKHIWVNPSPWLLRVKHQQSLTCSLHVKHVVCLGWTPESTISGLPGKYIFYKKLPNCPSGCYLMLYSHQQGWLTSLCTALSALGSAGIFKLSDLDWGAVMARLALICIFLMASVVGHFFLCSLWGVSAHICCCFLTGFSVYLWLSFENSLYILDSSPLLDI